MEFLSRFLLYFIFARLPKIDESIAIIIKNIFCKIIATKIIENEIYNKTQTCITFYEIYYILSHFLENYNFQFS